MFGGDDGYGGGGFDVSGYGNSETPQANNKNVKRADNLVPVTIRQVLGSSEIGLKIGQSDIDAQTVRIVGIVKKIVRSSIKVTYTIEDNTGSIDGVQWLESSNDESFVVPVVENTYAVMVGSIRNASAQDNQRHIMIFQLYPVTDLNEVTQHTLQIIYIHLKSEELHQSKSVAAPKNQMSSALDSSMDNSDYVSGYNLNPQQQRVLKAVAQNSLSELGASISEIMNSMTVKMSVKEVEKILDVLSSEGHIYSTSDDKHYKATDVS